MRVTITDFECIFDSEHPIMVSIVAERVSDSSNVHDDGFDADATSEHTQYGDGRDSRTSGHCGGRSQSFYGCADGV